MVRGGGRAALARAARAMALAQPLATGGLACTEGLAAGGLAAGVPTRIPTLPRHPEQN